MAQPENLYTITVYTLTPAGNMFVGLTEDKAKMDRKATIKIIAEVKTRLDPSKVFEIYVYFAKEIVDYSDKNIRFINNKNNLEEFITADYIRIQQTK